MSALTSSSTPSTRNNFRIQAKNLFLTWPQNDEVMEVVIERIKAAWDDSWLEFAIVCEEEHKSGEPHLHAVVALKKKWSKAGAPGLRFLDALAEKHGNYKPCKHLLASVIYVTKEGKWVSHGIDVGEYLAAAKKKTSTKATLVEAALKSGASLKTIAEEYGGFVMMNLAKLKTYQQQVQEWNQAPTKTWIPLEKNSSLSEPLQQLSTWLNNNLGESTRHLRQKQLLLSSPPGLGKTWMTEMLKDYMTVYKHPGSKWFDGFTEGHHQLMVFDEFVNNVPANVMNKAVDGSGVSLEVKGGVTLKLTNIPVMVLTNLTYLDLYPGANSAVREAFLDRFTYIRLEVGDNPWKLWPVPMDPTLDPCDPCEPEAEEEEANGLMDDEFEYDAEDPFGLASLQLEDPYQ